MSLNKIMDNSLNILLETNQAIVISKSSQTRGCSAENLLNSNDKRLWLTEQGLPQEVIIDISNTIQRPQSLNCFGWYCWHSYKSNPAKIELWVSENNNTWKKWGSFLGSSRSGMNLFRIDSISLSINFLKIIIVEAHGASNIYMNQLFLFENMPMIATGNSKENNIAAHNLSIEGRSFSYEKDSKETFREEISQIKFSGPQTSRISSFDALTPRISIISAENSPKYMQLTQPKPQIIEKKENIPLWKPSYYNLPKIDEIDRLTKEVSGWQNEFYDIQNAFQKLSSKVEKLQNIVDTYNSPALIKQIKEELLKCIKHDGKLKRSPSDNKDNLKIFEKQFIEFMKNWEEKVLQPKIKEIQQRSNGDEFNPELILKKIEEKLKYKAKLLKKKEIWERLNTMKFKYYWDKSININY